MKDYTFSIELATADDYLAVCELYKYHFTRMHTLLPDHFTKPPKSIYTKKEYKELLADDAICLFLAFAGKIPAALLELELTSHGVQSWLYTNETRQYINDFVVLPEYLETKLPKLLLEHAEKVAQDHDVKWVNSVIYTATPEIAELFQKFGYSPMSTRVNKAITPPSPTTD